MKTWNMIAITLIFLIIYGGIYFLCKKKKPFKRALMTMIIGVLSLIAVDVVGIFTGVYLPISPLSLTFSAVGGIPGVTTMLIIQNFV